jgi:decaprenylphospho-beta-D-erythro-pentofuranosid-2-ulose 2-reductase
VNGPVLILGGRSDIGLAVAHQFAAHGHPIQLAARNVQTLLTEKGDIELRYDVPVTLHEFDALESSSHQKFVEELPQLPHTVICAVGVLGVQADCERDLQKLSAVLRSNFEGPASILTVFANRFEERGGGTLVGISSVAGNRGRAANYVYGSAKAGFTAFLSGLRNRLARKGINVITVLPGFVKTKMTEQLSLPRWLTSSPEEIAKVIYRTVTSKRDVVYISWKWRVVMMVISIIPERIFKFARF